MYEFYDAENNTNVVVGESGHNSLEEAKEWYYAKLENRSINSLEGLKQARIIDAKARLLRHIYETYPIYKQLNIIRIGSDQEKAEMTLFIDSFREQMDEFENNVNNCTNEEELKSINFVI